MKKLVPTEQNISNIRQVVQLLTEMPVRLESLCQKFSDEQLRAPLAPGERTPTEVLAHILRCEALTAQAIYLALLTNEPRLADVHAERDLGKLLHLERLSFDELLTYYKLRRTMLMQVLEGLTEKQWARTVRQTNKQRRESVYWRARAQALHELDHVMELEKNWKGSHWE